MAHNTRSSSGVLRKRKTSESIASTSSANSVPPSDNNPSVKKIHNCPSCDFSTRHLIIFSRHVKRCNNEQAPRRVARTYKCKNCKFKTNQPKLFLYHVKENHSKGINIFPCDLCDYASRYRSKVLRHRKFVHKKAAPLDASDINSEMEVSMEEEVKQSSPNAGLSREMSVDGIHEMEQDVVNDLEMEENTDGNDHAVSETENDQQVIKNSIPSIGSPIKSSDNAYHYIRRLSNSPGSQTPAYQCALCTYSNFQTWKVANHVRAFHMKKKVFKCAFCPFVTNRKIEYCIHKAQHTDKKPHPIANNEEEPVLKIEEPDHDNEEVQFPVKCQECDFASSSEIDLEHHIKEYHTPVNNYEEFRPIDSMKLISKPVEDQEVVFNFKKQTGSGSQEITCKVCGLKVKNESKLRIHMVSHSTVSAHLCPLCTLRYKRSSDLNRHMKRKHGARLRDFFFMGQQEQPLNLTVTKDSLSPGPQEDQPVSIPSYSNADTESQVGEDQPLDLSLPKEMIQITENLRCSHCSYLAKWPSDLRRHLLVHSVEKRYKCPCCHRKYKYQFDLNMHLRRMHRMPAGRTKVSSNSAAGSPPVIDVSDYEVDNIPEETNEPSPSSNETSISSSENGVQPLQVNRYKLSRQQVTPQGKYKCNYCPYMGKYQSEVDRHMRLHTGDKPYTCLFCTYRSHWRGDMKRHLQKHHIDEDGVADDITGVMEKTYQPDNPGQISDSNLEVKYQDYNDNLLDQQPSPSGENESEDKSPYNTPPRETTSDQDGMEFITLTPNSASSLTGSGGNKSGDKRPNVCPYCPFTCEAPSKLKCHMEIHENLKRFKCAHCGKRSNWTWDVRKHIKKEHPGLELHVIVMEEDEARETLPVYLQTHYYKILPKRELPDKNDLPTQVPLNRITDQLPPLEMGGILTPLQMSNLSDQEDDTPEDDINNPFSSVQRAKHPSVATKRCRPFKCSKCGRRSNWKWDMNKHIRNVHPQAKLIVLSPEEARKTMPKGGFRVATPGRKENVIVPVIPEVKKQEVVSSPKSKHNHQFDSNRTKKFKCSACPYRSDYRSDIGRHLKRLHTPGSASIIMLSDEDARATLQQYKDRWVRGKFVFSPAKEKMYEEYDKQNNVPGGHVKALKMEDGHASSYNGSEDSASEDKQNSFNLDNISDIDDLVTKAPNVDQARKWKCPQCKFTNSNKKVVVRHMRQHPKVKVFRCRACDEASDYRNSMYRHVRNKHNSTDYGSMVHESIGYVTTTVCTSEEPNFENEDAPVTYRCKLCSQTSCWKSGILRHITEHHKEEENSKNIIEILQVSNITPATPQPVMGKADTSDLGKNFLCDICPFKTNKSGLLKIHQAYHKQQRGNKLKCKFCPYYVSAPRLLQQHIKLHTEENNNRILDEYDGGQMEGEYEMTEDIPMEIDLSMSTSSEKIPQPVTSSISLSPTGRRYYCDQCPAVSRNKNDFMYHKQFHRPKTSSPFKCKLCNYWVSQRRLLRQHERVHLSEYIQHYHNNNNNNNPKPEVLKTYADHSNGTVPSMVMASPAKSDISDYGDPVQVASFKHQLISSKIYSVSTPSHNDKDSNQEDKIAEEINGGDSILAQNLKTGGVRKVHQCKFCPYKNSRATVLRMHETMHGEKPGKDLLKCPHCDYYVGNKGLLSHHMKVHSSSYQPGQEDILDGGIQNLSPYEKKNSLVDLENLTKSHIVANSSPHPSVLQAVKGNNIMDRVTFKKWCCEKCPYATMKRAQFERHISLHGSRQKYICEFCDYSVPAYHLLLQHKKLHLQPNQNLLIAQSVSNLQRLPKLPLDMNTATNYFRNPSEVTSPKNNTESNNLYENTTEFTEPKKVYRCDRCPYQNIRRDHLLSHLKFHMVQSELKCPYCDYSVSKQHLLVQHIKVHFSGPGFENGVTPAPVINVAALKNQVHGTNKNSTESNADVKDEVVATQSSVEPETLNLSKDQSTEDKKDVQQNLSVSEQPLEPKEVKDGGSGEQHNPDEPENLTTSSTSCCYCERKFSSSNELKQHESQHLLGNQQ